eukprot:RCo037542
MRCFFSTVCRRRRFSRSAACFFLLGPGLRFSHHFGSTGSSTRGKRFLSSSSLPGTTLPSLINPATVAIQRLRLSMAACLTSADTRASERIAAFCLRICFSCFAHSRTAGLSCSLSVFWRFARAPRFTFLFIGCFLRTTPWTSSLLSTRLPSTTCPGRKARNLASSFLNALSVHTIIRPTWPPGHSRSRLRCFTCMMSTPGMFLSARCRWRMLLQMMSGPFFSLRLRPRTLPLPARSLRWYLHRRQSSFRPILARNFSAARVLETFSKLSETTRGISGTLLMLCPRASTRAGTAEAASAARTASLRIFTLHALFHFRKVFGWPNLCPPRHMFPKAPWPERWVPPPLTRGIRATARPVPQDSALVW